MVTPTLDETIRLYGWPKGVNNRLRQTESGLPQDSRLEHSEFLREAVNVDLTTMGQPMRRDGYTKVQAGYAHSLWSDPSLRYGLLVHEGWLSAISSEGSITPLVQVHPYALVSYCTVNGEVFWSNGVQSGRLTDGLPRSWGVEVPGEAVVTIDPDGDLDAGAYTVCLTYTDIFGEESGASKEVTVNVESGKLVITAPASWPDDADKVNVYASQPNGEVLYRVNQHITAESSVLIVGKSLLGRGKELETQHCVPPKQGKIVAYNNGRIYIARRDIVWFTEALRYALVKPSQGLYMFPGEVDLLAVAPDGIYVGHSDPGAVVFISGADPYDITQFRVLSGAPVPRACAYVPGEHFSVPGDVPVWWMQTGEMVAGLPGGQIRHLSKKNLDVGTFNTGAVTYRTHEGMNQVVSSLQKGEGPLQVGASDSAVASVRRNHIVLNQ